MADPSPPEHGLTQAVRRARLPPGSLAGPLDLWAVAVAAAQAVPDVLDPALERLTPSPYAGLAGLLADGGAARRGGRGGEAAPRAARRHADLHRPRREGRSRRRRRDARRRRRDRPDARARP